MADLIVTYTTALAAVSRPAPVESGEDERTETIEIGAESAAGTLTAADGEFIVSLLAEADCWVKIGADPTAVAGSGRKLLEGERAQYSIRPGSRVAVIQAA
jgi:hypothetical protein